MADAWHNHLARLSHEENSDFDFDLRYTDFDLDFDESLLAKQLVNESSYMGKQLSTDLRVPGRIGDKKFFSFWRDVLKAPDFILDTISKGYQFPFAKLPPSAYSKNNSSFMKNREFGIAELFRLEELGCITRVKEQPYITLPLTVVFSKKLRLVVDASRTLNPYIIDQKVKLESLDIAEQMVQTNDFQTCSDLDSGRGVYSFNIIFIIILNVFLIFLLVFYERILQCFLGYWHVPLHPDHKKFVGCHVILDSGEIIYFVWNVLFLGIKSAVYIFTKLLKPHCAYLRSLGIKHSIFIDDQRILAASFELCELHTKIALDVFEKAGWIVNLSKSQSEPSQVMQFLGLINSTSDMKYYIPTKKLDNILELLSEILSKKKCHIKQLAKVLGKIQFIQKATGPITRILCRSSYRLIANAKSWNCMIVLSPEARRELSYLFDNLHDMNGFCIRPNLSLHTVDLYVASDSSNLGTCVYEVSDSKTILHKRIFSLQEASESSTVREIIAFHDFYVKSKAVPYANMNLIHYTDSFNVSNILTIGSRNPKLQPLVVDIVLAWRKLNLKVFVEHIPRSDPIIKFADFHSRNFDLYDYSLDVEIFLYISQVFGPFYLDCFAAFNNTKCTRFYAKSVEDKQSEGTNFFAQVLPMVNLWVFPPIHLIIPTLFHLEKFGSFGVLIIPMWKSAHFWPFICNDGIHFNNFVKNCWIFSPKYISGEHILNTMFVGVKKFDTLALQFDFGRKNLFVSIIEKEFCSLGGCHKCF